MQTISRLKNENAKLRARVAFLEQENAMLRAQMGEVMLQLEELKQKIFGKRHKRRSGEDDFPNSSDSPPRSSESYRRPPPAEGDITNIKDFTLSTCSECESELEDMKLVVRYEEDILPVEEWHTVVKTVEKHHITTGYCAHCRKRVAAIPIPPQLVTLGANIKQLIPYLSVIQRMSFEQTRHFFKDIVHLSVSDGEMSNILEEQSQKLFPRFHDIQTKVSLQPAAHYDETSWKTQRECQGNYGWVKTGTETTDTVFLLGRSRGKGNAQELQAGNVDQIGITDDYGAYRNMFANHQLCWAHPLRKLRELKESEHLTPEQRTACQHTHECFATLYQELRFILKQPYDVAERTRAKAKLERRFRSLIRVSASDPPKLQRIKESLRKNQATYFTCLLHPNIPADNNKAERALRHLVLKRKISYGSKTQKGANVMSILCSVLLSLWWSKPKNFFADYSQLLSLPTS